MDLPEPNLDYVRQRLNDLRGDDRFYGAERAVGLVFDQWPTNRDLDHVLVKTVVLNRLYSTSIYDVWSVATRIYQLEIDDRLVAGDATLVHDIASVELAGKVRTFLSFATNVLQLASTGEVSDSRQLRGVAALAIPEAIWFRAIPKIRVSGISAVCPNRRSIS